MKTKEYIAGLVFLLLLISIIGYFAVTIRKENYKIDLITIEGNNHLSKEMYLKFANLLIRRNFRELTLQIIKDRIEKHPYVKYADVSFISNGKVNIVLHEKNFDAILIENQKQYLITDNLEAVPLLEGTERVDYPVITNPYLESKIKPFLNLKRNYDVLTASKILSGIKLINPELYSNLSVVDMRKGGDVVMTFSLFDYPVIFGRDDEARKIVYFNALWNYLKGNEANNLIEYIDLRYHNHIYFGFAADSIISGEDQT
ncbi:cell division protein FtsQ/DivIB [Melioribacter sp. OK-6-Me]|uniref:cell division protein FtsQ/DivIB n=1 Tax=unclassified Melioribacter TaxID=2627329 RepID=UPI003ED9A48D